MDSSTQSPSGDDRSANLRTSGGTGISDLDTFMDGTEWPGIQSIIDGFLYNDGEPTNTATQGTAVQAPRTINGLTITATAGQEIGLVWSFDTFEHNPKDSPTGDDTAIWALYEVTYENGKPVYHYIDSGVLISVEQGHDKEYLYEKQGPGYTTGWQYSMPNGSIIIPEDGEYVIRVALVDVGNTHGQSSLNIDGVLKVDVVQLTVEGNVLTGDTYIKQNGTVQVIPHPEYADRESVDGGLEVDEVAFDSDEDGLIGDTTNPDLPNEGQEVFPVSGPTTIEGKLGDLEIDTDGEYSYTGSADAKQYLEDEGITVYDEAFQYKVEDGDGDDSTANLTIRTQTEGVDYDYSGDDVYQGSSFADTFDANGGDDVLRGSYGDDTLAGGTGEDILHGGPGSDTLSGGAGIDTHVWEPGDHGPGGGDFDTDTINDFELQLSNGDILKFDQVLQGITDPNDAEELADYLHFSATTTETTISVDIDGGTDKHLEIVLDGVAAGDWGTPTSDADYIQILLDNNQLEVID